MQVGLAEWSKCLHFHLRVVGTIHGNDSLRKPYWGNLAAVGFCMTDGSQQSPSLDENAISLVGHFLDRSSLVSVIGEACNENAPQRVQLHLRDVFATGAWKIMTSTSKSHLVVL